MEEPSNNSSGDSSVNNSEGTNWWASWLNSAKEKSVSALNATKRDLAEFVTVLGSDTKAAVSGASGNIKGLLTEQPQDGDKKNSVSKVSTPKIEAPPAPYDRSQAQLLSVQNSTDTYLQEPKGSKYNEWRSGFNVQSRQSEISSLLVTCPHIRTLHSQLVPAQVSYETFWMRYFYKAQLLEQEEKLRAELMARASKPSEQQLQWDEEFEEVAAEEVKQGNGHQHSESSSDSFVCVSESATNEGERGVSQDPGEGEQWELVDGQSHDSSPKPERSKEELELDDLLGDPETDEAEKTVIEDSNSDWENWDD